MMVYVDVYMANTAPVVGFQFSVSCVSLSGASGGSADAAGFSVSTGPNGVIGFSLTGAAIPAGDGLNFGEFNAEEACIADLILSVDAEEMVIVLQHPGCTDGAACNYDSEATDDDGSCECS